MKKVIFATTNDAKFKTARDVCDKYGVDIAQKKIDIDEIQSEDPEKVAVDKARRAYEVIGNPVTITDESWSYPGLNGFPGAYMHSMNEWFSPEDFLRLVMPLKDRRAFLTQYLIYDDGQIQKIFKVLSEGVLLKEIKGSSIHANYTITSMKGTNGLSEAEYLSSITDKSKRPAAKVWHDFAIWYKESQKN
jgi:inosine/xanthosine triphosphate pyrophosphatase family protein